LDLKVLREILDLVEFRDLKDLLDLKVLKVLKVHRDQFHLELLSQHQQVLLQLDQQ